MPGDEPDRRHRDVPRAHAERGAVGEPFDRANTCRSFASGSPIPMNTTFPSRCGVVGGRRAASRRAHTTCAAISPAVRLFCRPICPVAQNVQPIAQPDCEETQTVTRSG